MGQLPFDCPCSAREITGRFSIAKDRTQRANFLGSSLSPGGWDLYSRVLKTDIIIPALPSCRCVGGGGGGGQGQWLQMTCALSAQFASCIHFFLGCMCPSMLCCRNWHENKCSGWSMRKQDLGLSD